MKAQRRHELKTNALARALEGVPLYWREYGSRALLVVLVAAIVYLLVQYWNNKKLQQARQVGDAVVTAQEALSALDQLPRYYGMPLKDLAEQRRKMTDLADGAISTILENARDPATKAHAYLARGELNWKLANLPEPPGAETQPSVYPSQDRERLLDQASSAWEQVVQGYPADALDVFSARAGLGVIAEDRRQWDTARRDYQAILDAANMPASFKQYAKQRLAALPQYEKPVLIEPPPPTTEPASTQPAALGPPTPEALTQPSSATQPTTAPAAGPATRPAP